MKYALTSLLIIALIGGYFYFRSDALPETAIFGSDTGGIIASEDSQLSSANPDTNYGSNLISIVGFRADSGIYRAVYKFNVTVPVGATIDSATLSINSWNNAFASPADTGIYGVTDNTWTEGTVTWNNQPSAGTLIQSFSTGYSSSATYTVTDFVASQLGEGGSIPISFMQKVTNETITTGIYWKLREFSGAEPTLTVYYTEASGSSQVQVRSGTIKVQSGTTVIK